MAELRIVGKCPFCKQDELTVTLKPGFTIGRDITAVQLVQGDRADVFLLKKHTYKEEGLCGGSGEEPESIQLD